MELDLTDEQRALRETARAFLEREAGISYAREMMSDARGWRDEVWRKMADLGWIGLPFPEDAGGVGMGFTALATLLEEMGRVVLPGPYFSTVMLAGMSVLEAGSDAQRKDLLSAISAGELRITAALTEVDVVVRPDGDAFRLNGEARYVMDGATADRIVVAVGDDLYLPEGPGLSATPTELMDATRKVAHVRFDDARAERLGDGNAVRAIGRVLDSVYVGLAAEMLGGAERVVELAVDYAKQRVQFDRPIGSFQAVKHRAADMLLDVESLRNAVAYAAWAIERDHPDASIAASTAKAYASDAYRRVAASGIQVHGGIGFTWEHDMHLYFKRAKASEVAFGSADFHRERLARLLENRYAGTT
ncbi:MAG: acyl-CoA dehydrogenase family protein [Actinomycetota bacterium]